CAKRSEDFDSW
nr:immunoglobulin heavy chain junction region [Macaca mulatta]